MVGGLAVGAAAGAFGAARLAEDSPEASLRLWPWRGNPWLQRGDRMLEAQAPETAKAAARAALLQAPLSAKAYALIGRAYMLSGDAAGADAAMAAAARRSLRDAPSQTWIFARALEAGDFQAALEAYDVLMRRRPELAEPLSPPIYSAADQVTAARAALIERLRLAPPWRTAFLTGYSRNSAQPGAVHALLSALRSSDMPPTDAEVRPYLDRLLREKRYVSAYLAWAEHHPALVPASGAVVDGGFGAEAPGMAPFAWTLSAGDGAAAQRAGAPDGQGLALQATASGGLARRMVAEQLLVLPSGDYQLTAKTWIETGDPQGRLTWTVRCENGAKTALATLPVSGATGRWTPIRADLSVPADCPAQRLRLEARPGASLAPVSVYFDDMAVVSQRPVGGG